MKTLFLFLSAALLISYSPPASSITKEERDFAVKNLNETRAVLLKSIQNLSDAQVNFKATPERWSIKECLEHITLAEKSLWQMDKDSLKAAADPTRRSEIVVTDDGLIKKMIDRTTKRVAVESIRPEKYPNENFKEVIKDFLSGRDALISYMEKTNEDMRNHFLTMPFGTLDSYQMILMISAHCNRHTQQINEVKTDPNYPGK